MRNSRSTRGLALSILAIACFAQEPSKKGGAPLQKQSFGKTSDGKPVELYTLRNQKGMAASIMTYGGALVSLTVPDRNGKSADVVLGCDDVAGYEKQIAYFGALVGRYANRIGHASFKLDGADYKLAKNNGENSLHGGIKGFNKQIWRAKDVSGSGGAALELSYVSRDGEEGFPGALTVKAVYTLTSQNELKIDYTATTTKKTIINLTNHSYFNLAGQGEGDILHHQLTIDADRFNPVDVGLIPTGVLQLVKGTPFDFSKATDIGARIGQNDEQIKVGNGYDHNWVLNKTGVALAKAAEVYEPRSGRVLEVWTSEPGLQFYTGNFLDGTTRGKGGKMYQKRWGFTMETQHFPDSPNKPNFPTTVLEPGSTFRSTTSFRFSTR